MKHATLFVLALAATTAQSQVITRQSDGTTYFRYDMNELVTIVDEASDGDTIILPGGPINLEGSLVIDKELVLIGAGMLNSGTPVTGVTTLIGTNVGGFQEEVLIRSSGAGSSFHGIRFDLPVKFSGFGNDAPTFSAAFVRCMFLSSLSLGGWESPVTPPAASNVLVKHCVFMNGIQSAGSTAPQGFIAQNCIIDGGVNFGTHISTADVSQCILLDMTTSTGFNPGVVFTNNIFTRNLSSYTINSSSSYYNNLFVITQNNPLIWSGDAVNGGGNEPTSQPLNNVFEDVGSYTAFSENYDYHLNQAPPSPGLDMGLGGYDVGIYDGPPGTPWKEDAIPFNPHWVQLLPAGNLGVTNGGVISVNLTGAAQQD